jgi:hypothetical protein
MKETSVHVRARAQTRETERKIEREGKKRKSEKQATVASSPPRKLTQSSEAGKGKRKDKKLLVVRWRFEPPTSWLPCGGTTA